MTISRFNIKKGLKEFYRASAKKPNTVDVPEGKFVTKTGRAKFIEAKGY